MLHTQPDVRDSNCSYDKVHYSSCNIRLQELIISIYILGSLKLVKGSLQLNSEEAWFSFKNQSFGHRVSQKIFLKGKQ